MKRNFMQEKGFYLLLLVAVVVVVGASLAYIRYNEPSDNLESDLNETNLNPNANPPVNTDENIIGEDSVFDGSAIADSEQSSTISGSSIGVEDENINSTDSQNTSQSSAEDDVVDLEVPDEGEDVVATMNPSSGMTDTTKIAWPLRGNVILPYSMDKTVYFKTLNQYKCNDSILITAKTGEEVVAPYAGKVTDISKDDMSGLTITIDHGNQFKTVSGQLKNEKVAVGDTVTEGQQIAVVADPTKYFAFEGTHVSFKLLKGETPIDPLKNLK